jgi:gamma-glutamyl hydrolase
MIINKILLFNMNKSKTKKINIKKTNQKRKQTIKLIKKKPHKCKKIKKKFPKGHDIFNKRTSVYDIHTSVWSDSLRRQYKHFKSNIDIYKNDSLMNNYKDSILCNSIQTLHLNKSNVIIGILTVPVHTTKKGATSYLPQAYVKWVESSGARVIPIPYNLPIPIIITLLNQIHGLLLPGGSVENSLDKHTQLLYISRIQFIINYITRQNLKGNYFPIFGICLGFQLLLTSVLEPNTEKSLNSYINYENISKEYYNGGKSITFKTISKKDKDQLISPCLNDIFDKNDMNTFNVNECVYFHHRKTFHMSGKYMKKMKQFLIPNAVVKYHGKECMCAYQFKSLPYYGTLFHPEKNFFTWSMDNIPHNEVSNKISYKLSNFFIDECRKNYNVYSMGMSAETSLFVENYDLLSYDNVVKVLFPGDIKRETLGVLGPCYYFGRNDYVKSNIV